MKAKVLFIIAVLVILSAIVCGAPAWAVDEGIFTPTSKEAAPVEDRAFKKAIDVFLKHDYTRAETLLRKLVGDNPNSRWAAEANLHLGSI